MDDTVVYHALASCSQFDLVAQGVQAVSVCWLGMIQHGAGEQEEATIPIGARGSTS